MNNIETLEFDKILFEIAKKVILKKSEDFIFNIKPLKNEKIIKSKLELLNDWMDFFKFDDNIDISQVIDLSQIILKLDLLGYSLSEKELSDLKLTLKTFRNTKNKILNLKNKYKYLKSKYLEIPTIKNLEDMIDKIIDEKQKIKTTASIEMENISQLYMNTKKTIKQKLESIISDEKKQKMLQEKIITIKNDRYVIPIKTSFKSQMKGVEQERSESSLTTYIEPMMIVVFNNKLRELKARKKKEREKILLRITDTIRHLKLDIEKIRDAIIDIDIETAIAYYSIEKQFNIPLINEKKYLNIINGYHPFVDKNEVVPASFNLGKSYNIVLITGPNTGGKTVLLKTIGLISMLGLSGLAVPADRNTNIPFLSNIFADIGDEQNIDQSLSSFSAHIKNIKEIFQAMDHNGLILLDELCSGTDPVEGAALAKAILNFLEERKIKAVITTHYSDVKLYAHNSKNIMTACMEFDKNTLKPTYKLLMETLGESNALHISKNLGLDKKIIDNALNYLTNEDKKIEHIIKSMNEKINKYERENEIVKVLQKQLIEEKENYTKKFQEFEEEKAKLLKTTYDSAKNIIKNAQNKANILLEKMNRCEIEREEIKKEKKTLEMLKRSFVEEEKGISNRINDYKNQKIKEKKIKIKDIVYSKSLHKDVEIIGFKNDKIYVKVGILKLFLEFNDIEKKEIKKEKKVSSISSLSKTREAKRVVDLRGENLNDAIMDLELELDSALLNDQNEIDIVHGKGDGILRSGIQNYLKTSRYVEKFRNGNHYEGGLGVTIVTLK